MIDGDDSDDSDDDDDDDDAAAAEWTRNYINAGWPMTSEDLQRVMFGTAQASRLFTSEDLFPKQFLMHQQPNPQFTSLEQWKTNQPLVSFCWCNICKHTVSTCFCKSFNCLIHNLYPIDILSFTNSIPQPPLNGSYLTSIWQRVAFIFNKTFWLLFFTGGFWGGGWHLWSLMSFNMKSVPFALFILCHFYSQSSFC